MAPAGDARAAGGVRRERARRPDQRGRRPGPVDAGRLARHGPPRTHRDALALGPGAGGRWIQFLNDGPMPSASAELYDPATGRWTPTGPLNTARTQHTATLLPSGQVLVAGGFNHPNDSPTDLSQRRAVRPRDRAVDADRGARHRPLKPHRDAPALGPGAGRGRTADSASAELYDPASGQWTPTGALDTARDSHTATLLPSGQVLVAGGSVRRRSSASAELYDPATGRWTPAPGRSARPAIDHTATLLPSGQVLVAGGFGSGAHLVERRAVRPRDRAVDRHRGPWHRPRRPHRDAAALGPGAGRRRIAQLLPLARARAVRPRDRAVDVDRAARARPAPPHRDAAALGPGARRRRRRLPQHGHDQRRAVRAGDRAMDADRRARQRRARRTPRRCCPRVRCWSAGAKRVGIRQRRAVRPRDRAVDSHRALGTRPRIPHRDAAAPGQVLVAGGLGVDRRAHQRRAVRPRDRARGAPTGALGTGREEPHRDAAALGPGAGRRRHSAGWPSPAPSCTTPRPGSGPRPGRSAPARESHTATLLPSGQVLVAGGSDRQQFSASAELYDPATGTWTAHRRRSARAAHCTPRRCCPRARCWSPVAEVAGISSRAPSCTTRRPGAGRRPARSAPARSYHTATLLPSGKVLVAGGASWEQRPSRAPSCTTRRPGGGLHRRARHGPLLAHRDAAALGPGAGRRRSRSSWQPPLPRSMSPASGFQAAWRPNLTFVGPAAVGSALGVEGSLFLGFSEAAGGGTQQSATNYPLVQLRRLDNEQTRFLPSDPFEPWTDGTFTSLPLNPFPPGPALVTVFTNGIPSVAKSIVVQAPDPRGPARRTPASRPRARQAPAGGAPRRGRRGGDDAACRGDGGAPSHRVLLRRGSRGRWPGVQDQEGRVAGCSRSEGGARFLPTHTVRDLSARRDRGQGTPFEAERTARPLHVDCGPPERAVRADCRSAPTTHDTGGRA